jgi:hypothetical protein
MPLALLFHYILLNMFRMLVHPFSGACDLLWIYFMCCIALVRCVLVLRCGLAGVMWYPDAGWSDIKLVYLYPTIKMMHGPINIRFTLKFVVCVQVFEDLRPTSQVYRITISRDNHLSLCRKEPAFYGDNHMKYCVDQARSPCRHFIQLPSCVKAFS